MKKFLESGTVYKKAYALVDTVSEDVLSFIPANNSADAIRKCLTTFMNYYPVKDMRLYYVGDYFIHPTSKDFVFKEINPILVDWSEYQFPETQRDNLKSLGLSDDKISQMLGNNNSASGSPAAAGENK